MVGLPEAGPPAKCPRGPKDVRPVLHIVPTRHRLLMRTVRGRPVDVPATGNVLAVVFDTFATLLMVVVGLMAFFVMGRDTVFGLLDAVVDPYGRISSAAYHVRLVGVTLLFVAAVSALYFASGWRAFRSSLGLRMMRVWSVLPQQPKFPAVRTRRLYFWRYVVPTFVLANIAVGLIVLYG